jgi:hypothetical protein
MQNRLILSLVDLVQVALAIALLIWFMKWIPRTILELQRRRRLQLRSLYEDGRSEVKPPASLLDSDEFG